MNYPISILIDKTADDIFNSAMNLSKERNMPADILSMAFEKAYLKVLNEKEKVLTDMVVDALNNIDKMSPKEKEDK